MRLKFTTAMLGTALALISTPAFADVKTGVDAWSRGDYPTAIKEWRPLAINGDADAQFNLGQAYKLGRGVPNDLKLAESWYRRAADQGHIQAEDNLGLILFQNGDRQKAVPFIEKSAARGEPRAQYVLGTALFNGDLVKKDWVRAYALMTRASAAGLAPASASLAQMDQFIPLDKRQKGLTMARELEATAARPQFASLPTPSARPPRAPEPQIQNEDIPPSVSVERPMAKPPVAKPPMTKPMIKPAVVAITKPVVATVAKPAPKPAVKPTPAAAAAAAITGPVWRVQLGAFGDQANARALWGKLQPRVAALGGLQPAYVKVGSVMRLQAGPLASKPAAERVCASVKASGQGCLPVVP